MKLSEKFEEALIYATRAHGNQTRKKTGIPFVAHILGVTAISLEYGANETEAIGALLHVSERREQREAAVQASSTEWLYRSTPLLRL